jgi:uncharacterized protein involved in outer membrane biogenesis
MTRQKIGVITAITTFLLVVLYTLGGFIGIPYLLTHVVPQKVVTMTKGGEITLDHASFNPFTFALTLDNCAFKTPQKGDLVHFDHLTMNVNPTEYLWKGVLVFETIALDHPRITLAKDSQGKMNFAWLLTDDNTTQKEDSKPLGIMINTLKLSQGEIHYHDVSEGKNYTQALQTIAITLTNIGIHEHSHSQGKIRLSTTLNNGGMLDLQGNVRDHLLKGTFTFHSGALSSPFGYVRPKMPIDVQGGIAHCRFEYLLDTADLNATRLTHLSMGLHGLTITPKGGTKKLVSLDTITLNATTIFPLKKHADVHAVTLHGFNLTAARSTTGVIDWVDYIDQIDKAFPSEDNETKVPWTFTLHTLDADGIGVRWDDHAPKLPYTATLEGIALHAHDLSSDPIVPLVATLSVGKLAIYAQNHPIGGWSKVTIDPLAIAQKNHTVTLGDMTFHSPFIAVQRLSNGTFDLSDMLYTAKTPTIKEENNTSAIPWKVALENLSIEKLGLQWSDHAPKTPYTTTLKDLSISVKNITNDPKRPITATLSSGALDLYTLANHRRIGGWKTLGVEGINLNLSQHTVHVAKVTLDHLHAFVQRLKEGNIDLQNLLYVPKDAPKSTKPSIPWTYGIGIITSKKGEIKVQDFVPTTSVTWNLNPLNFTLKHLSSHPNNTLEVTLFALLNGVTHLRVDSTMTLSPTLQGVGTFTLEQFQVPLISAYLEPYTYATLNEGNLSIGGRYTVKPNSANVEGKLSLEGWVIRDSRDNTVILSWDRIGVTPFSYAYPDNQLRIQQLSMMGVYTSILIDQNKTMNLSTLSKEGKTETNTTASKPASNPFGLSIDELSLTQGRALFSDLSLPLPFKTLTHDLEGNIIGISTAHESDTLVELKGRIDQYGVADIRGHLNTHAPTQMTDMNVSFGNLELKNYTPYSLKFLGYPILNGKLLLTLGYHIDHGQLQSRNNVVIKRIELGKEKDAVAPFPLKLVVALLEDAKGVINVDLPIEGNVTNPQFRYGKAVWQVLTNLFAEALTAPFHLLGSALGIHGDPKTASTLFFEEGTAQLPPRTQEKLDKLPALLLQRPNVVLYLHGGVNQAHDGHVLAMNHIVTQIQRKYPKLKTQNDALSLPYIEELAQKSLHSEEIFTLQERLKAQYPQEAPYHYYYAQALVEKLIPFQEITPDEWKNLTTQRTRIIATYLQKFPELATRVFVGTEEPATFKEQRGVGIRMEIRLP